MVFIDWNHLCQVFCYVYFACPPKQLFKMKTFGMNAILKTEDKSYVFSSFIDVPATL